MRDSLPGPESNEETEPRECENASVDIDGVQSRDGAGLAVNWVYHGVLPQSCRAEHLEAHGPDAAQRMLFEQYLQAGNQTVDEQGVNRIFIYDGRALE